MDVTTEDVDILVKGTTWPMQLYIARPEAEGVYPSCIVVGELFGLTDHIRDITRRIAALGYVAVAHDFYHRSVAGIELPYDDAGRKMGFELLDKLARNDAVADVKAIMDYLKTRKDTTGKIGIVGFSVGGHIAYLAATQLALAVAVVFYAGWLTKPDIPLSQPQPTASLTYGIARQRGRILYLVGELDKLILKEQCNLLKDMLTNTGVQHEIIRYPGVGHGFFCDVRDAYNKEAAEDAWRRTGEVLKEALS